MNVSTGFSPAQLMFSHNNGALADPLGGPQESLMVEGGESFQDIQQMVQACREKAAENLTKVRRAMKEHFDKRSKVVTE